MIARRNSPSLRGIDSSVPDAQASCQFAKDRHVAGIAAEGRDVLLHPREGGELVEQAKIGHPSAQVSKPLAPIR